VVGYNEGGTVESCYAAGVIKASGNLSNAGGVIGNNFGGEVKNCYALGSVTLESGNTCNAGGVVAYNGGTVENCYAAGDVTANGTNSNAGGVVGHNENGSVQNCVALNNNVSGVSSNHRVVGLDGVGGSMDNNYAWSGMTINNSAVVVATIGPNYQNGGDWSKDDVKTITKWTAAPSDSPSGLDFSFVDPSPWRWDEDGINSPYLEGVGGDQPFAWPTHLD